MGALPELMPFKAGPIQPVAMPGETLGIWVNKVYYFYSLLYLEPVLASDPLVIDFGALAAGTWTGVTQLTLLEMPDVELGQFRAFTLDDFHAYLWQARSDGRQRTKQAQACISLFTQLNDPCGHQTEFFVHEDDFAFVNGLNPTSYPLTQSRMGFYGFRYVLEKLTQFNWDKKILPTVWTRVPATAHL